MTPTARSMKWFRERGFIVARVEQRLPIPGKFITRDAFGIGDLLVAGVSDGIALVQVTSSGNLSAREQKILGTRECKQWVAAGGKIWLHGWAKRGPRGARKVWKLTERKLEDAVQKQEERF